MSEITMKLAIVGNCQHSSYREVLEKMLPDANITSYLQSEALRDIADNDAVIVISRSFHSPIPQIAGKTKVINVPVFYFSGFHPDLIMQRRTDGRMLMGPAGSLQSAIMVYGYIAGFSADKIESLFDPAIFDLLGYHEYWRKSLAFMTRKIDDCGMNGTRVVREWVRQGVFCHTANHPKIKAVETICREIVRMLGHKTSYKGPYEDPLAWHGSWPIYPGIAETHGLIGSYDFKFGPAETYAPRTTLTLREMIEQSLRLYDEQADMIGEPTRFVDNTNYIKLNASSITAKRRHVYSDLPATSYWQRSIATVPAAEVDPVLHPRFTISRSDRVVTAGSCFAQHIAKQLSADGMNYHIAETPPVGMPADVALAKGYGLFSARYGNIYTARQLRHLLERALGTFEPAEQAWQRPDGRWVDAYRPQIEPAGFATADEVVAEAGRHLAIVRQMFVDADVFVFTLGLTESWLSRVDGSAFPVAPGVVAGKLDNERYAFVNFRVADLRDDLISAITMIRNLNPAMRIILTVSPVPLVATFEDKHVLTANTYSKSALRATVEEVRTMFAYVEYFPSYEIITGNYASSMYFGPDKREVNALGIRRVMTLLKAHFFESDSEVASTLPTNNETIGTDFEAEFAKSALILCDEELLEP